MADYGYAIWKKETTESMTKGVAYRYSVDKTGAVRVVNNKGKSSKYGVSSLKFLTGTVSVTTIDRVLTKKFGGMSLSDVERMISLIDSLDPVEAHEDTPFDPDTMYRGKALVSEEVDHAYFLIQGGRQAYPLPKEICNPAVYGTPFPSYKELHSKVEEPKEDVMPTEEYMRASKEVAEEKRMEDKKHKISMKDFLRNQGVPSHLIKAVAKFRKSFEVDENVMDRMVKPHTLYQGRAWTTAIAALLCGRNILLEGEKATGKNILAMNLAFLFGRPLWDVSFHSNIDSLALVGGDTLKSGDVIFQPGILHQSGKFGGFCVLDEINMAKSEAVAVLHSALDDRRSLDVPGYSHLHFHDATRFIGTMNYGYTGTRELNEALVSRFVVIKVESPGDTALANIIQEKIESISKGGAKTCVKIFNDLQTKAKSGEITSKAVDFRGLLDAMRLASMGVSIDESFESCIINKCFDDFEKKVVRDTIKLSYSGATSWFTSSGEMELDFSGVKF